MCYHKPIELINEFGKRVVQKINTQESVAFIDTDNKRSERKFQEKTPFIIISKRIKYLGINLPEETKEQYTENYDTMVKEIKDNINRWRDIPCSWVGRINIVKIAILLNVIYRFSAIPIKLPMAFFTELGKKISQFIWKHKQPKQS